MARIALIGYGKMGKTIEQIAIERGNTISKIVDIHNQDELVFLSPENTDVAVEFTQPESAVHNISVCLKNGVRVVCGTTGWLEHRPLVEVLCHEYQGGFFYASNFSIGVNIFFNINSLLAKMMNKYPAYKVRIQEIHHIQKKDAPSGTAITLAENIIQQIQRYSSWKLQDSSPAQENQIPIEALRIDEIPGIHTIWYESDIDAIEIKHTAHNRKGFAYGAVLAAEFMVGKKGIYGMKDLLGF
ncbi:MAG: 4-hydroxy-tetrahydrodipicolinate reductase [Cytophagales bacterium]|nr:4-hydroxy-tetrahydrodipicolinate reductase [Cytophagales bacterium]MDW8385218.1 4-hydroxy-tetrahydrodipicolinate reductase [Flammeovirgaceae bacterium]